MNQLAELLHIDDTPRLTPLEVRSGARQLKAKHAEVFRQKATSVTLPSLWHFLRSPHDR